jgi:uncharacterized repeat protein (TIGR01451 family)
MVRLVPGVLVTARTWWSLVEGGGGGFPWALAQSPPPACPLAHQIKIASAAQVKPGGPVRLMARIVNTGTTQLRNLDFRFTLPQGTTPIKVATRPRLKPPRQPIRTSDGNLYSKGLTINPGKARIVRVSIRLGLCAPAGPPCR